MLLKEDDAFLLDIRSDASSYGVSETAIHRKLIELYKSRDDFRHIDLRIQTPRGLSGTTRVDLSNALAHMRNKCGKTLRKLEADMDYMDPSVHEFVLLQCLSFSHICLTSNPEFEQTEISVGLAMSLHHALTLNTSCTRVLDLTCAISGPVSELLAEAMRESRELQIFRLRLLGASESSRWISGILEGLTGKSTLETLHLRDVNASVSSSLATLLGDSKCRVQELSLSYDWALKPPYNTHQLCEALADMAVNGNESVKTILLDGIPFDPATNDEEEDVALSSPSQSAATTRVLPLAFPQMETLSLAAPRMPRLAFLDLPQHQLPHQLKHCYFPCPVLDVEQGRNLVEALPNLVDIPDFESDPYVEHLLDWRKVLEGNDTPTTAALWPHILERTNTILKDHPRRRANMLYTLIQAYYGLQRNGQLEFPPGDRGSEEEEENVVDVRGEDMGNFNDVFDFAEGADGDY